MMPFIYPNPKKHDRNGMQPRTWLLILRFCLLTVSAIYAESRAGLFAYAQSLRAATGETVSDFSPLDLNLRIVWGGSETVDYLATIELDGGVLTGTQLLGIDANDSSFVLKDSSNRLTIDDPDTRFGGCDIHVEARPTAVLKIRLQLTDPKSKQTRVKEASWSLKSLREGPDLQETGLNDCRLSIDRIPGDRLRVITSRTHMVFNSEEPLGIQILPYAVPWTATVCQFECALFKSGDYSHPILKKTRTLSLDGRGNAEPVDMLINAPIEDGVYELRFSLEPKRVLPAMLIKHTSVERTVQFVVFNSSPATKGGPRLPVNDANLPGWRLQSVIPLTSFEMQTVANRLAGQIEGSRRFPFLEMIKSFSPIPNDLYLSPKLGSDESRMRIAPGAFSTATLTNLLPGEMHRLVLSTPSVSAACRVLIAANTTRSSKSVEPPFASEVFDISNARAIQRVTDPLAAAGIETFEVLFWPNSRTAKIDVSNLNGNSTLEIESVQLDVWKSSPNETDANANRALPPACILELHSANVRRAFGFDPDANGGIASTGYDDWRMFLRFAERLASYCKANGFDCLATTVHAEGGSLFPTSKLSSNARFDTGTFSNDARDPMRKDVVELMFRVMLRHGIQFVPMLELDSPIREVEETISKVSSEELFQHRGSDDPATQQVQLYNPLAPRVQQAITSALDEFESRYRAHPNYQGYALRATQASHLVMSLPIEQTNTKILDRYYGTVVGNLPRDATQREQFVSQRMQAAYSQWLRDSVAEFYSKLKSRLRWVSVESEPFGPTPTRSPEVISPILIGLQHSDFTSIQAAISTQWNFAAPKAIHVGMDKPVNRMDSKFVRFAASAESFQLGKSDSIPYRDNVRTVSKVRVWSSKQNHTSILLLNAGAVTESVALAWVNPPQRLRLFSSLEDESSNDPSRVELNATSKEWSIRIAAGESVRIDLPEGSDGPVHWSSQETNIIRSLDVALNSLEQGVSRLSTPQRRAATLINPSFEEPNNEARRGRIFGWTTSIDPNAAVEIDSRRAFEGRSSIRMESANASSIEWIQSDPFALPQSDRLFVSLQASADSVPQQVTISLSKFDAITDRFETIAIHEIADRIHRSKAQTQWTNVGIDLSNELQEVMQARDAALYRLQVEVKGTGRIWLDDFAICTSFLRERERRDLRSELFLARTSLQNGDTSPAVAMLNSPRGRLIQWGDSYENAPKVMVSHRDNGSVIDATQAEPRSEPNAKETKLRPVKRLRNYWWQRKE